MIYAKAASIAEAYREMMLPYCDRAMVAGSIRRGKAQVKDIELVCAPKLVSGADPEKLFGEGFRNLLYEWALDSGIVWIKPGTDDTIEWPIKPDGLYWRGVITAGQEAVKLDVFLTTVENFGTTLLIRTGSSQFNQALMSHARMIHRPCANNHFHHAGEPVEFEEEYDVFDFLGLEYVEPNQRVDGNALRSKRKQRTSGFLPKGARRWPLTS
jgi:DNA polymerase/3'-5' exonuclease PolX